MIYENWSYYVCLVYTILENYVCLIHTILLQEEMFIDLF